MSGDRPAPRWRFLIQPKWLGWHALIVAAVLGMLALGNWQLHRALAGNALSWAYTFEWPIFAVFAIVFWGKTIWDEFRPPARSSASPEEAAAPGGPPARAGQPAVAAAADDDEDDEELAAYNAYLSRLNAEVKGHGRWHGLR